MASISIAIWVDSDGNVKVTADDSEAFDDLDSSLATRKVVLNVDVPEPEEAEIDVTVPADKPTGTATVKVEAATTNLIPVMGWQPPVYDDLPVQPVLDEPAAAKRSWFSLR